MKLTVIAATGRTGPIIVAQALEAGHDVTAVARHPDGTAPPVHAVGVDLKVGDAADLQPAVERADAVLSTLGPRSNAEAGIASHGTREVMEAMEMTGARRLLVVSAGPVGTVPSPARPHPPGHDPGDGLLISRVLTPVVKVALRRQHADLAVMEDAVRECLLGSVVRGAAQLTAAGVATSWRRSVRSGGHCRGPLVPGARIDAPAEQSTGGSEVADADR